MLFFNEQLSEAGIYDVLHDGAKQDAVAFNYDRKESLLNYYTDKELQDVVAAQPKESHVQLITGDSQDITGQIMQTVRGKPLWFYFILVALACLLAEVAILRLWKNREKSQIGNH